MDKFKPDKKTQNKNLKELERERGANLEITR